jgi:hypothetical protein
MEEEEATACAPAPEPEPVVAAPAPTPAPATAAETIAVATTGNHVVVSPHEVVSTTTTGGKKRKELEQQTEQEKMAQREGEEHDANKKPHVEVFVPCQDARLLWWDADESVESKLRRIKQCMQLQYGERMKTFRQCMEVNALWIANAMEKTAVDQSGDTYRMLEELQAQPSQDDDTHAHTWPAEGGNNRDETRAQMKCHLRASQYLMRQSVLTNEAILKAHAILMHGAVDEYGKQVLAGTYRNHPSHNGAGFVYVEPNDIPRRMRDSVNDIAIGSDEEDVLVGCHATARFVHAFLITHCSRKPAPPSSFPSQTDIARTDSTISELSGRRTEDSTHNSSYTFSSAMRECVTMPSIRCKSLSRFSKFAMFVVWLRYTIFFLMNG